MKKIILVKSFLILASLLFAQGIPGKKLDGPVTFFDTIHVAVGDTLVLGIGTFPAKNFKYVFSNDWQSAPESMSGKKFKLKGLKSPQQTGTTRKIYGIINPGGQILNWGIDIENALKYGEIVAVNNKKVSIYQPSQSLIQSGSTQTTSKPDLTQTASSQTNNNKEYKVILERANGSSFAAFEQSFRNLEAKVNNALREGWSVTGGITETGAFLAQAVTR